MCDEKQSVPRKGFLFFDKKLAKSFETGTGGCAWTLQNIAQSIRCYHFMKMSNMIQSHSFYKYVICVALKSHRTRFNLGCPVYPKVLFPPLSVYRPINLFWKHNTKWLSNLLWQILQHWISCPFVRLSSFLPIMDVILLVYIRKNLVFFANAWWPWSKIWKYLERIPSNNTPLVSCHLKSKLQFFLPIMMEAHILKESKYLKVSWDLLSVTNKPKNWSK